MRKLITSVAILSATSALACSFSVGTKGSNTPQTGTAPAATPAPTTATGTPTPVPAGGPQVTAAGGRVGGFGGKKPGSTTAGTMGNPPATGTGTATPAGTGTAVPASAPVMAGANPFGSGTVDPNGGWRGTVYWIPAGTTKMPALASMTANGYLFASTLNVAHQAMSGGFPGIDATRNENFAIRFEGPLLVENEADYELRVLSDDGAIVSMDGMVIVDNDGNHDAKDKTGPVHLLKGTHLVQVDYFQTTGKVALQLFVKKMGGGTEQVFPARL